MRAKQYSIRTEKTYLYWIHAFIRFHNCQHPKDMGVHEIRSYLDYFAIHANVTPNTQLNALVFMYGHYFNREPMDFSDYYKAKAPAKLPTILNNDELQRLFAQLDGVHLLAASLMYGSGLRVMEVVRLRVQDIDLDGLSVFIREGKSRKSRIVTLAEELTEVLSLRIETVNSIHKEDLKITNWNGVYLPYALERKYPNAPFELGWQYLFPAQSFSTDPRSNKRRRHHIHEQSVQRNKTNDTHT